MNEALFMVFQVAAVGQLGEGFAVGWVVVDSNGIERAHGLESCDPAYARTAPFSVNQVCMAIDWTATHVCPLDETCCSPKDVRDLFWDEWLRWKARGAVLVSTNAWPAETNFLTACLADDLTRTNEAPLPLYDLASVLLAAGRNPTEWHVEGGLLNPLADARTSARLLLDALS